MTTIKDAMDRAARECSVKRPSSWISSTVETIEELRDDFLLQTVDELLDRVDWPGPIGKQTTITGDGTVDYTLPSDFRRLARDPLAVYETTTTRRAAVPVATDGEWTHLNQIGTAGAQRYYRIRGYDGAFEIDLFKAPSSSVSVTVSYVSNLWMASSGGTAGSAWTDEADVLLFPRRLIETGVVWRFRKRKGLVYDDVMAEYEALLARYQQDARNIRTIAFGDGDTPYKPMRVPVPDYIPSS